MLSGETSGCGPVSGIRQTPVGPHATGTGWAARGGRSCSVAAGYRRRYGGCKTSGAVPWKRRRAAKVCTPRTWPAWRMRPAGKVW